MRNHPQARCAPGKPGKKRVRKLGRQREELSTVQMGLHCLLEGGVQCVQCLNKLLNQAYANCLLSHRLLLQFITFVFVTPCTSLHFSHTSVTRVFPCLPVYTQYINSDMSEATCAAYMEKHERWIYEHVSSTLPSIPLNSFMPFIQTAIC